MFVADYDDPWRGYQKEFAKVEAVRLNLEEEELTSQKSYQDRIAELEAEQQGANDKLADRRDQIAEVEGELEDLGLEQNMTRRQLRAQNALRDVARANYDLAVRDAAPADELSAKLSAFEEQNQKANDLLVAQQQADAAYEAAKSRLQVLTRERDELNSQMKAARAEVDRIRSARFKVDPDNWFSSAKRSVMEWPIID